MFNIQLSNSGLVVCILLVTPLVMSKFLAIMLLISEIFIVFVSNQNIMNILSVFGKLLHYNFHLSNVEVKTQTSIETKM